MARLGAQQPPWPRRGAPALFSNTTPTTNTTPNTTLIVLIVVYFIGIHATKQTESSSTTLSSAPTASSATRKTSWSTSTTSLVIHPARPSTIIMLAMPSLRPHSTSARPPTAPPGSRLPISPEHFEGARSGPFFEEGDETVNITAIVGINVTLDCYVGLLADKTVTWLYRKSDAMELLTVGRQTYSADPRFNLVFRYPSNWQLNIESVTRRDSGFYECQISTHPPRVKPFRLRVTAPEVHIVDENGHSVSERYYKAGSVMELTCIAGQLENPAQEPVWLLAPGQILDPQAVISLRRCDSNAQLLALGFAAQSPCPGMTPSEAARNHNAVVTTLLVENAERKHTGNYTCTVPGPPDASAVVSVHVLNGELPAAVHDGSDSASPWVITTRSSFCCILPTFLLCPLLILALR